MEKSTQTSVKDPFTNTSYTSEKLEYDAFIRSIKRNADSPHVVLIGAGASISSGIQSAGDCIWEWKRDIFTSKNPSLAGEYNNIKSETVRDSIQRWLDSEGGYPLRDAFNEYSFYANSAYPIPEDRRKYFQALCEKKEPYVGYKALMLLAEAGIVKSIWSTNFDGLVIKAAHQANLTPIEITLDSTERVYRNESKSEILSVALHGDYKYGELKNTERELDNQNEIFVQTLQRYLIDKNLIVVGYSGRDSSLMAALKSAFEKTGTGRLYWCGYGDRPSNEVMELIRSAKNANREAYYISTDGFDKIMLHLAKACFETNETLLKKLSELTHVAESNEIEATPFSIGTGKVGKYIKSNLHPISLPKEVFQFEISYDEKEKVWDTIRTLCGDHEIAAVPFKKKVFALSTKSLINQAFGSRLKSEIVRVPINRWDIKKVGVFKELILNAILSTFTKIPGIATDKKNKLWLVSPESITEVNGHQVAIHKAVYINLYIDNKFSYLSFKPDLYLQSTSDLSKEVRQSLTKPYFEKLFNNKYEAELEFWGQKIFGSQDRIAFEFPLNSGSALNFTLSKDHAFAKIIIPNQQYVVSQPSNFNPKTGIFEGIQYLEPELVFRDKNTGSKHTDFHPMRGLTSNLPFDNNLNGKVFSSDINLGIICPSQYSNSLYNFLNGINQSQKAGVNPDYLLDFPGFLSAFRIPLNIPLSDSAKWQNVQADHGLGDSKTSAIDLARKITTAIDRLCSTNKGLVVVVFIPNEWQAYRTFEDEREKFNLHDYIKAYAAQKGVSTQLIEEGTLNDNLKCQIYWWLSLSFYVKSLRTPWVLSNLDKTTAFAGIGYSVSRAGNNTEIVLGCSHIYNSEGQGLKYKLTRIEDFVLDRKSNPFMSYNDAYQFGVSICELFYNSMGDLPKRVVVHKKTPFTKDEINGIKNSLAQAGIKQVDLVEISFESDVRFLATKIYSNQIQIDSFPISRGSCVLIEPNTALLWTHGIVPSVRNPNYKFYLGGRSIPSPLKIKKHYGNSNLSTLATEILGLTKMNWNSFDLYTKFPSTIESSNEIARIGRLLSRFEGKTYDYRLFI